MELLGRRRDGCRRGGRHGPSCRSGAGRHHGAGRDRHRHPGGNRAPIRSTAFNALGDLDRVHPGAVERWPVHHRRYVGRPIKLDFRRRHGARSMFDGMPATASTRCLGRRLPRRSTAATATTRSTATAARTTRINGGRKKKKKKKKSGNDALNGGDGNDIHRKPLGRRHDRCRGGGRPDRAAVGLGRHQVQGGTGTDTMAVSGKRPDAAAFNAVTASIEIVRAQSERRWATPSNGTTGAQHARLPRRPRSSTRCSVNAGDGNDTLFGSECRDAEGRGRQRHHRWGRRQRHAEWRGRQRRAERRGRRRHDRVLVGDDTGDDGAGDDRIRVQSGSGATTCRAGRAPTR